MIRWIRNLVTWIAGTIIFIWVFKARIAGSIIFLAIWGFYVLAFIDNLLKDYDNIGLIKTIYQRETLYCLGWTLGGPIVLGVVWKILSAKDDYQRDVWDKTIFLR